mgnify:CR=1 FL=1
MPKFLIIDGSSMLSTSYYGNLPNLSFSQRQTRKKRDTIRKSCTPPMENTQCHVHHASHPSWLSIRKVKPEYVAFTFDMTRDTSAAPSLAPIFTKPIARRLPSH